MNNKIFTINIIAIVCDAVVCALALACSGWAAYFFGKWWIILVDFIPLALYYSRAPISEKDIEDSKHE